MPVTVLLVDDTPERGVLLSRALSDLGYQVISTVSSRDNLVQKVRDWQPDIIIVDMDVPGRDMLDSMRVINRDSPKPVVMFAEQGDTAVIRQAISAGVSAYVVDGLSFQRLQPVLEAAIARFQEFQALKEELQKTRTSLAERKIIDRAKGVLMTRRGLSEEEAYGALRKMAMDQNKRLVNVASDLLSVVDLLDQ